MSIKKNTFMVVFILTLCIHLYLALSLEQGELPQLTEYRNEVSDNGYFFKFSTNDGNQREERGEIIERGGKTILVVTGFYSYVDNGKEYFTEYESDENGYRATTKIDEPSVGLPGAALASLAGGGLG